MSLESSDHCSTAATPILIALRSERLGHPREGLLQSALEIVGEQASWIWLERPVWKLGSSPPRTFQLSSKIQKAERILRHVLPRRTAPRWRVVSHQKAGVELDAMPEKASVDDKVDILPARSSKIERQGLEQWPSHQHVSAESKRRRARRSAGQDLLESHVLEARR
jgi:hypothetical protein